MTNAEPDDILDDDWDEWADDGWDDEDQDDDGVSDWNPDAPVGFR